MAPLDPATGLPNDCEGRTNATAAAPVARLTNREYLNTLEDLFAAVPVSSTMLPTEAKDDGFDNVARNQAPTAVWVEAYFDSAETVSAGVAAALTSECSSAADAATCTRTALSATAERIFRRPMTADEQTRLLAMLDEATPRWGIQKGVELAVRGLLQSPQFLYRLEKGTPSANAADNISLTGHEVASRLSYLLWDSAPDAELLQSAASGALLDSGGLEAQARRLMASPRARAAVAAFHEQWLRFEKMSSLSKSESLFPAFGEATAAALRGSTERFVDHAFWEQGGLGNFLTSPTVFANAELAPILGLPNVTGSELVAHEAPGGQRAGILTQAGLLAGFAHETASSPVLRGVFVLDRLLCAKPLPPPPDVPPAPTGIGGAPSTTRQKFEQHLTSAACGACHKSIDGIGFAFENYDAVGAYRTQENGLPVDAGGELRGTLDVDGPVNGAVELGAKLAQSKQVQACVSRYWYRYAFGLADGEVDSCALLPVVQDFEASGYDLRELVAALVRSDSFRTRPPITD